jgi:hypothetical protein
VIPFSACTEGFPSPSSQCDESQDNSGERIAGFYGIIEEALLLAAVSPRYFLLTYSIKDIRKEFR